ncbi:MAG: CGGC domain-containing protein [Oliverpabstia sp.]
MPENRIVNIGILTCIHSNDVCTRAGCLNAFNHRTDYFSSYPQNTELKVLMTCNGCKEEWPEEPEQDKGILEKLDRIMKEKISIIHVGVCCLLENKEECERITKICRLLEKQGVHIIRGTHRE